MPAKYPLCEALGVRVQDVIARDSDGYMRALAALERALSEGEGE